MQVIDLDTVTKGVAVGVDEQGVGARGLFLCLIEPVAIGVGNVEAGAVQAFLQVSDAVAVGIR